MNAVENQAGQAGVVANSQEEVFFADNVGVTFANDNEVAKNPVILDVLSRIGDDEKTVENGFTTISVSHTSLAYFLHSLYASAPENAKIQVLMDGIYAFEAEGVKYNAQLMSVSQQPA